MKSKTIALIISLICLMTLVGCNSVPKGDIEDIYTKAPNTANVNEPVKISVQGRKSTGYTGSVGWRDRQTEKGMKMEIAELTNPKRFAWKVDDPSDGAKVSPDGVFTASKPGKYTIRTSADNTSTVTTINVIDSEAPSLQRKKSGLGSKKEEQLFYNGNAGGVENGGKSPQFKLAKNALITQVKNYHWNNGSGASPLGEISLKDSNGKTYGPWKTTGADGQGGGKNCYWIAVPNVELKAGTYTIIDSDPSTWAQNSSSSGFGMAWVFGKQ